MSNYFIRIEYDTAYRAVVVLGPKGVFQRFETGDVVADYARAVVTACLRADHEGVPVMESSSVNDFVHDIPGYRWSTADLIERDPNQAEEDFSHYDTWVHVEGQDDGY